MFKLSRNEALIVEALQKEEALSYQNLQQLTSLPASSVYSAVNSLEKKKVIERLQSKKWARNTIIVLQEQPVGYQRMLARDVQKNKYAALPNKLAVAMTMRNLTTAQVASMCNRKHSVITEVKTYSCDPLPGLREQLIKLFGCDVCTHNYPQELLDAPRDVQVATINAVLRHIVVNWDKWFRVAAKKVLEKKA